MGVMWTHIDCASTTVSKSRVLGRVHEEIHEQMQAVDDAMREIEDVIGDHLQDRGEDQGGPLCEKWMRAHEQRDAALKVFDQRAMTGCIAKDRVACENESTEHINLKVKDQVLCDDCQSARQPACASRRCMCP
jgi:hypothetical protein